MRTHREDPLGYIEPLFRPPSEGMSAIVQATLGCSWNRCAYCDMYASKAYGVRPEEVVERQIIALGREIPNVRKAFVADGNAFGLPYDYLMRIAELVHTHLPRVERLTAYSLPSDIRRKSEEELQSLRAAGYKMVYIGVESGHDPLLKAVNKSENSASSEEGILKARGAGIKTSIMIINGLGGKEFAHGHAQDSAALMNRVQPEYLSTLSLFLPRGLEDYQARFGGEYVPQDSVELLEELREFLGALELEETVFRSNHVSNLVPLAGTLGREKGKVLETVEGMIAYAQENTVRRFRGDRGY